MDSHPCRRRRPTKAMAGPSRAVRRAVTAALLAIGPLPLPLAVAQAPPTCPDGPPPGGCQNGLFSPSQCLCECIPPFCRDGSGACTVSSQCSSSNPWEDCVLGEGCPWWDNPLRAESCTTGKAVPPGVWEINATRAECCAFHHPESEVCGFRGGTPPPTPGPAPEYGTIPIRFVVVGLPAEVDEGGLREEMLAVLRRVLTDVAKAQRDLKITNIEESSASDAGGGANGGDEREAHFDVTVLCGADEEFGPVFVAWLKESYGDVVEYLEHYQTMRYFGYGIDFYWCVDRGVGEQRPSLCSYEEEVVPVDFRLAHLPNDFDVDELAQQMKSVYNDLLGGVERLDILSIAAEVVNVTGAEGNTKDVFLDIHVLQKYGMPDFAPAIHDVLNSRSSEGQVFDGIRSYADAHSLDLDWHVDSEGAYAVRSAPTPREDPSPPSPPSPSPPSAFPIWAIATIAAMVILSCCCCFCCVMWRIQKRDAYKNERSMAAYLQTGTAYTKSKSRRYPQRKQQPLDASYPSLRGPPPRHHKQHRKHREHRRSNRHGGPRHESHKHKSHKHKKSHNHESHKHKKGRETALEGHRRRLKDYRKEVSNSEARRSSSRARPPRKDTEYELKNAKSFVFPQGDGNTPPLEELDDERGRGRSRQGRRPQGRSRQGRSHQGRGSRGRQVPRMDTEYQLEHMPTFVFGDDGDDSGGGRDGDCPLPHLDLAREDGSNDGDRDGGGDGDCNDGNGAHRPDPDGMRSSIIKTKGAGTVDGGAAEGPPQKFVVHEVDSL